MKYIHTLFFTFLAICFSFTTYSQQVDGDKVYTAVEVNPTFKGGEQEFNKYLAQNIRYPKEARENKATGKVWVQFIVEKDGSLSNIKIVRDQKYGMGDEAVRVLKACPKWQPGTQNGKAVRVMYTVPVAFYLSTF